MVFEGPVSSWPPPPRPATAHALPCTFYFINTAWRPKACGSLILFGTYHHLIHISIFIYLTIFLKLSPGYNYVLIYLMINDAILIIVHTHAILSTLSFIYLFSLPVFFKVYLSPLFSSFFTTSFSRRPHAKLLDMCYYLPSPLIFYQRTDVSHSSFMSHFFHI